jgi:hypothetical protein
MNAKAWIEDKLSDYLATVYLSPGQVDLARHATDEELFSMTADQIAYNYDVEDELAREVAHTACLTRIVPFADRTAKLIVPQHRFIVELMLRTAGDWDSTPAACGLIKKLKNVLKRCL